MVKMIPEDELHEHPTVIHLQGVADYHRKEAQNAVNEAAKAYSRLAQCDADVKRLESALVQAVAERDAANSQTLMIYEKYEKLQARVLELAEKLADK